MLVMFERMEDTNDHFSLKWNNFQSSFTEGFHDFLQEEMMVDVTLAAEGKFLQAHKLVLSVCSSYFKNLFNVNPCKHPIVILKDVSHHELSCILQFMYKGEVGVKHEELPAFLKLADNLKLKGLTGLKVDNEADTGSSHLQSNISSLKKKRVMICSDVKEDNGESDSSFNRLKGLRPTRQKKRRLTKADGETDDSKFTYSRKIKARKSDLGIHYHDKHDEYETGYSENDTLVELFVNKIKDRSSGTINVNSNSGVFESEDLDQGKSSSDECELTTSLNDSSAETEQAPQEFWNNYTHNMDSSNRKSYIWNYFIKCHSSATCKLCDRKFKGYRPHASIESHLKNKHPKEYKEFTLNREKQRQSRKNDYLFFTKLFERIAGNKV